MEHIMNRRGFVKWGTAAGAAAAMSLLTGCGTPRSASSESAQEPQASESADNATAQANAAGASSAAAAPADASAGAGAGGKVLVAVFSWSGNTLQVAERIGELTGGDLFRIEPQMPYSTVYDEVIEAARAEQQAGALPPVAGSVEGWSQYDTVFLGYPIWWYDAPQIIKSFAADYDFAGKTVVPFCTSGGSQLSTSLQSIETACAGASLLDGVTIPGSGVSSHMGEVDAWVERLGL